MTIGYAMILELSYVDKDLYLVIFIIICKGSVTLMHSAWLRPSLGCSATSC